MDISIANQKFGFEYWFNSKQALPRSVDAESFKASPMMKWFKLISRNIDHRQWKTLKFLHSDLAQTPCKYILKTSQFGKFINMSLGRVLDYMD
jgi:hypothetical protein